MRILGRILIGITIVLLLAIAGTGTWLYFTDLGKYKPQLETLISTQTGREFTIGGDLELKLLPQPHLLVEDVSLANADWGSTPIMAQIGLLAVDIKLSSLINHPILVHDLRLSDVEVLLEKNGEGIANTIMGASPDDTAAASKPAGSASGKGLPLLIQHAELSNIKLIQRAAGNKDKVTYIKSLVIAANENDQLALNGSGEIMQRPLALQGVIGPIDEVHQLGDIALDVNGSWGLVALDVNGRVADLGDLEGVALEAILKVDDVADIIKTLELPITHSGPLTANVSYAKPDSTSQLSIDANAGNIAATVQAALGRNSINLDATLADLSALGKALGIADLPQHPLALSTALTMKRKHIVINDFTATMNTAVASIQGQLSPPKQSAQLTVNITGKSLADLDASLPAIPFQIASDAQLSTEQVILEALNAKVGKSDLSGRVELADGERMRVAIDLRSKLLDLSPFTLRDEPAGDQATAKTAPPADTESAKKNKAKQQYVFVDEPLPLATLAKTDADIKVQIKRWRNHDNDLRDIALDGTLHNKDLKFVLSGTATHGGKLLSEMHLNTTQKTATLDAIIRASELQLSKDSEGSGREVPITDITIDIDSKGNTPRALAAASNGRVLLTQGPGQVENAMLESFSGDILAQLFSALNPFAKDEKYTRWDCTVLSMDIVDGESTINGMLLQGEKIMVVGGGDIDLHTEDLKVTFNTKPRKGIGISADMFVTPFVQLGGTLAHPKVELNAKGAVVTTGAAFATMGISLLVTAAAERATAEGDKCEKTLAELPPHAPIK